MPIYLPDPPSFFPSLIFRRGVVAEGLGLRLAIIHHEGPPVPKDDLVYVDKYTLHIVVEFM